MAATDKSRSDIEDIYAGLNAAGNPDAGQQRFDERGEETEWVPDEVWLQVFERLPWAAVAAARTVCKRWRSLLTSPHFNDAVAAHPPWLYVSTSLDDAVKQDIPMFAYEPVTDTWYTIPMGFCPGTGTEKWTLVSSTDGLVYVMQQPCRELKIDVFSPVTKKRRTVAYSSYRRGREPVIPVVWTFPGNDASHSPCHHLVVASSSSSWGTRLYCPSDGEWEEVGERNPRLQDPRDAKYACSLRDELFFVLVEDEVEVEEDEAQVEYRIVLLGFDVTDGSWEEYNMFPFERAEDAVIVDFCGHLLLVAAFNERDRLCIRVYRFLERKRDAWVEVACSRPDLFPVSFSEKLGFFQLACASTGNLLYVVGYAEDDALACVCDLSTTSTPHWRRITNLPFQTVGFCFSCHKKIDTAIHCW